MVKLPRAGEAAGRAVAQGSSLQSLDGGRSRPHQRPSSGRKESILSVHRGNPIMPQHHKLIQGGFPVMDGGWLLDLVGSAWPVGQVIE